MAVDAPPVTFARSCGHDADAVMTCRHCGGEMKPRDLKLRVQGTRLGQDRNQFPVFRRLQSQRLILSETLILSERRVGGSPEVAEHLRRRR